MFVSEVVLTRGEDRRSVFVIFGYCSVRAASVNRVAIYHDHFQSHATLGLGECVVIVVDDDVKYSGVLMVLGLGEL